MSLSVPLCHDLLRLAPAGRRQLGAAAPAWVRESLARAPWVVVRRAGWQGDTVAVGVRGDLRSQRHAGWIDAGCIEACWRPHELLPRWRERAAGGEAALARLGASLPARWQAWGWHEAGPGGSWGFELASGLPSTHAGSDLDLVVRLAQLPAPALAAHWLDHLREQAGGLRLDVLLELPVGGLALSDLAGLAPLAERVARMRSVLLRRPQGPQLHNWASLAALAEPSASSV